MFLSIVIVAYLLLSLSRFAAIIITLNALYCVSFTVDKYQQYKLLVTTKSYPIIAIIMLTTT